MLWWQYDPFVTEHWAANNNNNEWIKLIEEYSPYQPQLIQACTTQFPQRQLTVILLFFNDESVLNGKQTIYQKTNQNHHHFKTQP